MSTGGRLGYGGEDFPGYVALDAADRFGLRLAFCCSAVDVGPDVGISGKPNDRNAPESRIELTVPTSVEAVSGGLAAAGRDRVGPGEGGEGSFISEPVRVVARADENGRGGVRADALSSHQRGGGSCRDPAQTGLVRMSWSSKNRIR